MRVVFLILIFLFFIPSYASVKLSSTQGVTLMKDGGGKSFKKRKYKRKRFKRVSRKNIFRNESKAPHIDFDIKRRTKGKAILMAVLTGPLGGHRLYLGTKPYVPIIYALTLGGGFGLLPTVDIVVIILSKDLTQYYNNPKVIMW